MYANAKKILECTCLVLLNESSTRKKDATTAYLKAFNKKNIFRGYMPVSGADECWQEVEKYCTKHLGTGCRMELYNLYLTHEGRFSLLHLLSTYNSTHQ